MAIKTMKIWQWALLLLASFVLAFLMYALAQASQELFSAEWLRWPAAVAVSAAMVALYALFVKWFERHQAGDIPLGRLAGDTLRGLAIGFCFFVAVVLVMSVFGIYRFDGFGMERPVQLLTAFLMFLLVAVGEEIIFRGVLFRWIDEKWGFAVALTVSALLFGLMHLPQPGATLWSSFAIAVEAGLLLGAAYKYAGTLWLPIGIHWAWNFTQGNIFGFEVSGGDAGDSLVHPLVSGPDILTGGAFGAEASVITVAIGLALSVWFIVKVSRRKV